MSQITLKGCGVIFDEATHTYTTVLTDEVVPGVTSAMDWQLGPGRMEKYDGSIVQVVLNNAADFGHSMHAFLEDIDNGFEPGVPELNRCTPDGVIIPIPLAEREEFVKKVKYNYALVCEYLGLTPLASEYLISYRNIIASSIDKVYTSVQFPILIGDVKWTSSIHHPNLAWQLGIYCYLFKKQNPHLSEYFSSMNTRVCIHGDKKTGEISIWEVGVVPDDLVEKFLECQANMPKDLLAKINKDRAENDGNLTEETAADLVMYCKFGETFSNVYGDENVEFAIPNRCIVSSENLRTLLDRPYPFPVTVKKTTRKVK